MSSPKKANASSPQSPAKKAIIIGIYGVPGCGKSYLMDELRNELGAQDFAYYDGSAMLADGAGGLEFFQRASDKEKTAYRRKAIEKITDQCTQNGQVGLVTGHCICVDANDKLIDVWSASDGKCYTHIIVLNVDPRIIVDQRTKDKDRERPKTKELALKVWQEAEINRLREVCQQNSVMLVVLSLRKVEKSFQSKVLPLLDHIRYHDEAANDARAIRRLDEIVALGQGKLDTILVLDADRTLAPQDSGRMFWKVMIARLKHISTSVHPPTLTDPLKHIFGGPLGYSYEAFCQAAHLYEEIAEEKDFDGLCDVVATGASEHLNMKAQACMTMYPEIIAFLRNISRSGNVGIVVLTCGLQRIWEKVLEKEESSIPVKVKVIGGGRFNNSIVVTGPLKAKLVSHLEDTHRLKVWAFGDSILDLEMLQAADNAIVVVGDKSTRSTTIDSALLEAIKDPIFRPRQVLLPKTVVSPFDRSKIPHVSLSDTNFISEIQTKLGRVTLTTAPSSVAHILQTPTRDSSNSGPILRSAHRQVGRYLATEFLPKLIGTELYLIYSVQKGKTEGYRFADEAKITIVACMRGGESMAFGVNDAMPLAMFVHSHDVADLKLAHFQEQRTVILVDSVVNSGKTIVDYVKHIRGMVQHPIRIIVVAGVVQAQSVKAMEMGIDAEEELDFVALRKSDNKFTGKGTTDTGNRLFNTTHIP